MSTDALGSLAARAVGAVLTTLDDAGIEATSDAGAFYPAPVGVLVGLPTLVRRGLASSTYSVVVRIVSGDPLNNLTAVDRLYALADDVAFALSADQYSPSSYSGGSNMEPMPAVELAALVSLTYTNGGTMLS